MSSDTDVASYIFNWHSLAQRYFATFEGSELVLSFMSIAELRMGAISLHNLGEDSRRCAGGGTAPEPAGRAWIAATALALDAPLATNNGRHYDHVAKLRLLTL